MPDHTLRPARTERPSRHERQLAQRQAVERSTQQGRMVQVRNDTQLAGFKAEAAIALGIHIMQGVTHLDETRSQLAGGDVTLSLLLADIEAETLAQVKSIQRGMFDNWGFEH